MEKEKSFLGYYLIGDNKLPRIQIGRYYENGTCDYEFHINFELVGGIVCANLGMWEDAFKGLLENTILFSFLYIIYRDENCITVGKVIETLNKCGYVNIDDMRG